MHDNVILQDNESTILLDRNSQTSSLKCTCHIEIWYFFIMDQVMDQVKWGQARVTHCPTDIMLADYLTKPLQGTTF